MNMLLISRILTFVGYFGLIAWLMAWIIWLAPSAQHPKSLVIIFTVGPLLFPLRGLLHGKPYTHAWTSLLVLIYFIHGVGEAYAGGDKAYLGYVEVLFTVILFTGAVLYTRYRARELRAQGKPVR